MLENPEKKNVSCLATCFQVRRRLQRDPSQHEARQDELDRASFPLMSNSMPSSPEGPRCVNGELVRPTPPRDNAPSTAWQASTARARGGVRLGKAKAPCFGSPPSIVPSQGIPPPPPPSDSRQHNTSAANPVTYPLQWTPLTTRPKSAGGGGPQLNEPL